MPRSRTRGYIVLVLDPALIIVHFCRASFLWFAAQGDEEVDTENCTNNFGALPPPPPLLREPFRADRRSSWLLSDKCRRRRRPSGSDGNAVKIGNFWRHVDVVGAQKGVKVLLRDRSNI